MPKVTISEYDNTTSQAGRYVNFAVVVPGCVEAGKGVGIFDENGIYECSSQRDFKNNIGIVLPTDFVIETIPEQDAVAPTVHNIEFYPADTEQTGENAGEEGSGEESGSEDQSEGSEGGETPVDPKEQVAQAALERFLDWLNGETVAEMTPAKITKSARLYIARANEANKPVGPGENGITVGPASSTDSTLYVFEPVGGESVTFDRQATYFWIYDDERGSNYIPERQVKSTQYGNQIAYELLGLGYTVLYKKLALGDDLSSDEYWEPLRDKGMYDFRYIVNGVLEDNEAVNNTIIKLAHHINGNSESGRGDCIALVDVDEKCYSATSVKSQKDALANVINYANNLTASQYAAIFTPAVTYSFGKTYPYSDSTHTYSTLPASFHYLACAAKAFENYNEWYAVAGYARGISNYSIVGVSYKLGEAAIDKLQPRNYSSDSTDIKRAVNAVIKLKNAYYLWGNRTAYALGSAEAGDDLKASHFLNIRQLCTTIKKQTYVACRKFTFDPNSDVLWVNFKNEIRPTLEKMKGDQGLNDYKFSKIRVNKKALLAAKIRIVPIEAVEDFDIKLYLEDSLGGISVDVDELEAE